MYVSQVISTVTLNVVIFVLEYNHGRRKQVLFVFISINNLMCFILKVGTVLELFRYYIMGASSPIPKSTPLHVDAAPN